MDEPDAPLSFVSCLSLVALLHDLAEADSQVVVATHSPIVAAVPGATIFELGEWGIRPARWEELEVVQSWRTFLGNPERFLHYLFTDDSADDCDHEYASPDRRSCSAQHAWLDPCGPAPARRSLSWPPPKSMTPAGSPEGRSSW